MLRAFNGECDAFTARVTYRNVITMQKRIESAFEQINKLADAWYCQLSEDYLRLRLDELNLVYEYAELKERARQEQMALRERIREEEREARESELEEKRLEEENRKYEQQLAKEKDERKIQELLKYIEDNNVKRRSISLAEITKAGYVYVLSNVGSFGENVFKIGMSRRRDPEDRVRELGDASVPFPFDVHAMISVKNAPAVEKALHNHFDHKRLNLENYKKEFFAVTIEEIRDELHELKDALGIESEIELTLMAEAKQYRMSEAKRKFVEGNSGAA